MDFRSEKVLKERLRVMVNKPDSAVCEAVFAEVRKRGFFAKDVVLDRLSDDEFLSVVDAVVNSQMEVFDRAQA